MPLSAFGRLFKYKKKTNNCIMCNYPRRKKEEDSWPIPVLDAFKRNKIGKTNNLTLRGKG